MRLSRRLGVNPLYSWNFLYLKSTLIYLQTLVLNQVVFSSIVVLAREMFFALCCLTNVWFDRFDIFHYFASKYYISLPLTDGSDPYEISQHNITKTKFEIHSKQPLKVDKDALFSSVKDALSIHDAPVNITNISVEAAANGIAGKN